MCLRVLKLDLYTWAALYSVAGHRNQALHLIHMSCKWTGDLFLLAQTNKPSTLRLLISLCLLLLFTPGSLFGHCTKNRQPLHAQQKETFTFSSLLPIHFDRLFTHSALCSMNNKKISCAYFLWRSKKRSLIHFTSDSTLMQMMMIYSWHTCISHPAQFSVQSLVHRGNYCCLATDVIQYKLSQGHLGQ